MTAHTSPVLHGDVSNLARALMAVPWNEREELAKRIVGMAMAGHLHNKIHGKLHPEYGNGSIMAAARKFPLADEPTFGNRDYLSCWQIVLNVLGKLADAEEIVALVKDARRDGGGEQLVEAAE